jgi:hypothetical protein
MCAAAQAKHVPRQPIASRPNELSGQPTVLAKPAIRVMPVIALRGVVAVDAAQRAECRVVQAEPHPDAEQKPRGHHHPDRCRRPEESKATGEDDV